MKRTASLLLLGLVAALSVGSSCSRPTKTKERRITLYPVGETAELDLTVVFPDNLLEESTCGPDASRDPLSHRARAIDNRPVLTAK